MKINNSLPSIFRSLSFLTIIAIWLILSYFIEHRLFPSPYNVIKDIGYHLSEGELIADTIATFTRAFISFSIAMILGSIIGYLLAKIKILDYFFDSWVIIGLNIPAIVLVILFYIWLGLTETALIAAVVLFAFGTGPIKGFAVTLSLGIVTSMFTAIIGTRSVVNLVFGGRRLESLPI